MVLSIFLYIPLFAILFQVRTYGFTYIDIIEIYVKLRPDLLLAYPNLYPNASFYEHICNT